MNNDRIDALARSLSAAPSRRGILRALAGLTLGGTWGFLLNTDDAEAKKKRKKKRKKKKRKENQQKGNGATSPPPGATCTPSCAGKACGDDGCGGSCDTCGADETCLSGTCVCASGFKICLGACIAEDECCSVDCDDGNPCTTDTCDARTCVHTLLADGAPCGGGAQCIGGVCVPPPTCAGLLGACTVHEDCCSAACQGTGRCACSQAGEPCHASSDCCANPVRQNCVEFICVPR
jgi:hypothetical protein